MLETEYEVQLIDFDLNMPQNLHAYELFPVEVRGSDSLPRG